MTPEEAEALAQYRIEVLTVLHEGFAFVVLALSVLVMLAAVRTVRHW